MEKDDDDDQFFHITFIKTIYGATVTAVLPPTRTCKCPS